MDYKQKQRHFKNLSNRVTNIWTRTEMVGLRQVGVPYVKAVHGLIGSDKVRAEKRANELSKRRA